MAVSCLCQLLQGAPQMTAFWMNFIEYPKRRPWSMLIYTQIIDFRLFISYYCIWGGLSVYLGSRGE